MNLGDCVRFTSYVGKVALGEGVRLRAPFDLDTPLEGIIIAKSRVYDTDSKGGHNGLPATFNPKPVYIVAVSLTKRFKVFAEDLEVIEEEEDTMRKDPDDLEQLVIDAVNARLAKREEFTAFDITQELRRANPGLNILHSEVRDTVHLVMAQVMFQGAYDVEGRDYNGAQAQTYFPL